MSKHTPGPWVVIHGKNVFSSLGADAGDGCKADDDDRWYIADCEIGSTRVAGLHTLISIDASNANARLISAAPELLEALELLLGKAYKQNFNDAYPEILEKCEAAIAKAKLEQDQ